MKKISLYLDTSVIGGYFDAEFAEATRKLFHLAQIGVYRILLSDVTLMEIRKVPASYSDKFETLLAMISYERVNEHAESKQLADLYIQQKVLPPKFIDDARHVSIVSCYNIDYIIGWNFKHLANVNRIKAFNAVNLINGYPLIDIRTPLEVIGDE